MLKSNTLKGVHRAMKVRSLMHIRRMYPAHFYKGRFYTQGGTP